MTNASSRIHDLKGLTNGLALVFRSAFETQSKQAEHYVRSFVVPDVEYFRMQAENALGERLRKTPIENVADVGRKFETLFTQTGTLLSGSSNIFKNNFFWFTQKRTYYSLYPRVQRPITLTYDKRDQRLYSTTTSTPDVKSTTVKVSTANVAKFRHQV